jgi:hypothetical protein
MKGKVLIRTTIVTLLSLFTCTLSLAEEQRFIDNGDGTITDSETGLMWAQSSSPGDLNWEDAETYCKNPAMDSLYLKYDDWRMPTIEELRTLYSKDIKAYKATCGLKIRIDSVFDVSCAWIWSAELSPAPHEAARSVMAYVFDLGRGYQYADRMVHQKNMRALPVRDTLKDE